VKVITGVIALAMAMAATASSATASGPPAHERAAAALAAVKRLRLDYAHWARTCYRIRDKHGKVRPLVLRPNQLAVGRSEAEQLKARGYVRSLILKGRQGGFTTDQQARSLHQIWHEPGFDALTLTHAKDATEKIFLITQRAIEHFPPPLLPTLGDKETSEISFPGLDAYFFTGTAGSKRTGRGLTIKRFHGSEFFFWDDPAATLGTVTPGLVPRGSVVTLESTASGYDSDGHTFWREAKARGYVPLFFPWWECDPENYRLPLLAPDELGALEPEEAELARVHGLDLEQLKWRRMKLRELGRAEFLKEYAEDEESCWIAAGGMFYDAEQLKALLLRAEAEGPPVETHMNGALELYGEIGHYGAQRRGVGPNPERVIIGADTAEGVDADRSTWVARAFPSWKRLAVYQSNRVEPREFARVLDTWGRRFGGAFLVPEKNMHGITVIRHLRDDHAYPTDRIYHRVALDTEDQEAAEKKVGWHTSGESLPLLLDAGRELIRAALEGHAQVPNLAALKDAFAVRRDKNGKVSLNGKDVWVAECLAWIGRSAPIYEPLIGRAR
jgi:hypothetical protein